MSETKEHMSIREAVDSAFAEYAKRNGFARRDLTGEPTDEELRAGWQILRESFKLTLNANDLFYYATADATEVDSDDFPMLVQAVIKFGSAGEAAFQSKVRGYDETPIALDRRGWEESYPLAKAWMDEKWLGRDLDRDIDSKTGDAERRLAEQEKMREKAIAHWDSAWTHRKGGTYRLKSIVTIKGDESDYPGVVYLKDGDATEYVRSLWQFLHSFTPIEETVKEPT